MNDDQDQSPSLSDAQTEREARRERINEKQGKNAVHVILGQSILDELAEKSQRLMYADNQCWLYKDGVWKSMTGDEEKKWLNRRIERGCRLAKMTSSARIVNETRQWLERNPDIYKEGVPWDAHGMIATTGGMIDWRPDGQGDRSITPEDYCTRLIDCENDPDADCPIWKRVLTSDYRLDEGTIQFLQEIAGVSLVLDKPQALRRALVLLGPSNSGKSNILGVIAGLISDALNTTELKLIENAHGLVAFLKPHPWVLHEAFDQSRWEMSATVKALLSADPLQANVKSGPLVPFVFRQPVLWGTNVAPQFKEASRAMESRLAIIKMHRAFDRSNPEGTALEAQAAGCHNIAQYILKKEKAGVLNWAIDGLVRAMERGRFEFTEEMNRALHQMRTDGNMALGFIEQCCDYSPDHYINSADFYGAFNIWHRDHRAQTVPTIDSLGRAMGTLAEPRVLVGEQINGARIYAGIKLNEEGMDCWNAYSASQWAVQSGQRISGSVGEVNKTLTRHQLTKPSFQAMREAHGRTRPRLVSSSE